MQFRTFWFRSVAALPTTGWLVPVCQIRRLFDVFDVKQTHVRRLNI